MPEANELELKMKKKKKLKACPNPSYMTLNTMAN